MRVIYNCPTFDWEYPSESLIIYNPKEQDETPPPPWELTPKRGDFQGRGTFLDPRSLKDNPEGGWRTPFPDLPEMPVSKRPCWRGRPHARIAPPVPFPALHLLVEKEAEAAGEPEPGLAPHGEAPSGQQGAQAEVLAGGSPGEDLEEPLPPSMTAWGKRRLDQTPGGPVLKSRGAPIRQMGKIAHHRGDKGHCLPAPAPWALLPYRGIELGPPQAAWLLGFLGGS